MAEGQNLPHITAELAQAVTRLGYLRRQLKELETEEALLRDRILSEVEDWPREVFPVKVGSFDVRLAERKGRIDAAAAYQLLSQERLLAEMPSEPSITDAGELEALGRGIAGCPMPAATRSQLIGQYKKAVDWAPSISHDSLLNLYQKARLAPEQYRRCFKEGKSSVVSLTVR